MRCHNDGVGDTSVPWNEQAQLLAGTRLRRVRLQQGLSIRQLSELADMSKTSVVQVEAGRTSRKSTYLKVASVLGLHLENLLQTGTADGLPYAVHRKSDDRWFDLSRFDEGLLPDNAQGSAEARAHLSGVTPLNILSSRLEQGRIKPTIMEISAPSERRSHAGEEHVFVLSGTAVIGVGEYEVILEEGESITFWSAEPHSYMPHSNSKLPVRLLSVRVDA